MNFRLPGTVIARRGDEQIHYRRLDWLQLLIAIPLKQFVYTFATMAAKLARNVTWRGVTYVMKTPDDVKLVEDSLNTDSALGQTVSL